MFSKQISGSSQESNIFIDASHFLNFLAVFVEFETLSVKKLKMAKRKVSQEDLRKMMAQVKTSKAPSASGPANKKFKLSSRELALLEEQKREDERKKAKERERKAAALAGIPKPDAVPQKSILKNKSAPGSRARVYNIQRVGGGL
jgi:hypothetical protein